ncbi:MAG: hypothetical protein M5R40_14680 [Anaerolineae bacterium]|nr:hypothetical protein [Anaerolineae bacterium]
MKNDTAPPWMWRSARVGFGLIAAALALGALALAAGAADPPVAGPLRADLTLSAEEGTVRLAQPWARTQQRTRTLLRAQSSRPRPR